MNRFEFKWLLFRKNGIFLIGVDHFLAMFPASILVPVLINTHFNTTIIEIPTVIFANAIGTLLFLIITKKRTLPAYLGSSFAYIGLTKHLISDFVNNGEPIKYAYNHVLWAYIFASLIILILSFIYRYNISKRIMKFLFPPVITGPVISLIGLELASFAANDAGFNEINGIIDMKISFIAIITLFIIIIASVFRRPILKNSSIIIGVIFGYILSVYVLKIDLSQIKSMPFFKIPKITSPWSIFPGNFIQLFFSVLPATIVIFMENISRITVISRLKESNEENEKQVEIFSDKYVKDFLASLKGHAASIFLSANLGAVPTTIYAENIAIMSINNNDVNNKHESFKPFSIMPYIIAAIVSIFVSILGWLQYILMNIPKPVIGGVELFLFGIIAAPGIQMLVEHKVNYRKVSNQILTASVLVAGIGGFSINFGIVEIKGMSLGLIIGVALNILLSILKYLGLLNENLSFSEVVQLCREKSINKMNIITESENKVEFNNDLNGVIIIEKRGVNTFLRLKIPESEIVEWKSIYDDIINRTDNDELIEISISAKIPIRHLNSMIASAINY